MTKALSPRLAAILAYVRAYRKEHSYSPSVRDIAKGCGSSSTTANYHVDVLVERGLLLRDDGIARSIRPAPETAKPA